MLMMPNQKYDCPYTNASRWSPRPNLSSENMMSDLSYQNQGAAMRIAPPCPVGQMTQEQLLEWIGLTKFACVDANLYLDTHPSDVTAIRYFQECNRLNHEAMNEYARVYGPLTVSHARHCSTWWDWVDQPWPWQCSPKSGRRD